jgi:hypothetical protein
MWMLLTLLLVGAPLSSSYARPVNLPSSQPTPPALFTVYLPTVARGDAAQPAKPQITSFTADASSIAPGGNTTLRWNVAGATSLSITPNVGAVTGTSVVVQPAATTMYTLLATNGAGQASATVQVVVGAPANEGGGFFAHREYLTYNAATAVDAQGGIHLAFNVSDEKHDADPTGVPALYTYCPGPATACAEPSKWSSLVALTERVNQVQIAVTPDGRPRMLVGRDRAGTNWSEYIYFACEQNCTDANNWSGLIIAQPAGIELFDYYNPQHSFALDSQGRPRFVYANTWGNGEPNAIHYAYCDEADCTAPGSWSTGDMRLGPQYQTLGSDYVSLAFDGDHPRVVLRTTLSGLPDAVYYFACDAMECVSDEDWASVELPYPGDQQWANWDLALDAQGRPRVALYEPAPIDIYVGGKLYYAWCDADDCAQPGVWQQTLVVEGEGKNVDLAFDAQGRAHMVYDAGQHGVIGEAWCDADCSSAAQWENRILETSEQLQQEFAPASPFTCDQDERQWLDAIPSVAFDSQGRLVVAYDTRNVTTCYYTDPSDPTGPPLSRVERLWWAIHWSFFPSA